MAVSHIGHDFRDVVLISGIVSVAIFAGVVQTVHRMVRSGVEFIGNYSKEIIVAGIAVFAGVSFIVAPTVSMAIICAVSSAIFIGFMFDRYIMVRRQEAQRNLRQNVEDNHHAVEDLQGYHGYVGRYRNEVDFLFRHLPRDRVHVDEALRGSDAGVARHEERQDVRAREEVVERSVDGVREEESNGADAALQQSRASNAGFDVNSDYEEHAEVVAEVHEEINKEKLEKERKTVELYLQKNKFSQYDQEFVRNTLNEYFRQMDVLNAEQLSEAEHKKREKAIVTTCIHNMLMKVEVAPGIKDMCEIIMSLEEVDDIENVTTYDGNYVVYFMAYFIGYYVFNPMGSRYPLPEPSVCSNNVFKYIRDLRVKFAARSEEERTNIFNLLKSFKIFSEKFVALDQREKWDFMSTVWEYSNSQSDEFFRTWGICNKLLWSLYAFRE